MDKTKYDDFAFVLHWFCVKDLKCIYNVALNRLASCIYERIAFLKRIYFGHMHDCNQTAYVDKKAKSGFGESPNGNQ